MSLTSIRYLRYLNQVFQLKMPLTHSITHGGMVSDQKIMFEILIPNPPPAGPLWVHQMSKIFKLYSHFVNSS